MLPYVQLEGEWDEPEKNSSPSLPKKEEERKRRHRQAYTEWNTSGCVLGSRVGRKRGPGLAVLRPALFSASFLSCAHGHLGLPKPFQGWLTSKHPPFWTRDSVFLCKLPSRMVTWRFLGFPGGSAVRRSPPNAGDVGLIPDPGRRSMQLLSRCSRAQELHLLKPGHSAPVLGRRDAATRRSPRRSGEQPPTPGPARRPHREARAATETQPSSKEVTT